jgi:hypothetical protein
MLFILKENKKDISFYTLTFILYIYNLFYPFSYLNFIIYILNRFYKSLKYIVKSSL